MRYDFKSNSRTEKTKIYAKFDIHLIDKDSLLNNQESIEIYRF